MLIEDVLNRRSSNFDPMTSMKNNFESIEEDPRKLQEKLIKVNRNNQKKQEEHKSILNMLMNFIINNLKGPRFFISRQ